MNIFGRYYIGMVAFLSLMTLPTTYAQVQMKGKVTDSTQQPLAYVTTELFKKDTLAYQTVTDETGAYLFEDIKSGEYLFKLRHFSLAKDSIQSIQVHKNLVLNIALPFNQTLDEIVVQGQKPVLKREIDRLIFQVENTDLVVGNSVWEVLEKTPTVHTNAEGDIQISGVTNAVVYINDRRKVLSGPALKSYLSSLPSNNLHSIEVITTPPSKYEAEGGAGIINIMTKPLEEEGVVGNGVISSRQTHLMSTAASANVNYRKDKWNAYSTLYAGDRNRKATYQKNIQYVNSPLLEREIQTKNRMETTYPGTTVGVDYAWNQNNMVGVIFDYFAEKQLNKRDAYTTDRYSQSEVAGITQNRDDLRTNSTSFNFNYERKLDSLGQVIQLNYDTTRYNSSNRSSTFAAQPLISAMDTDNGFRSNAPQEVRSHAVKVDYEWPVSHKTTFESGAKWTQANMDNTIVFENTTDGARWELDPLRSNQFTYKETILALYASFRTKVSDQFTLKMGIRAENTLAKGWLNHQLRVDKNYFSWFPTVYLKYTTTNQKDFVLALSSRISRPSYWDVNPFRTYVNDETYTEGNPFLNPSKYYRQELSHTLKSSIGTFVLQFASSQTLDEFYALPYNPEGHYIVNKKVNYGNKFGLSQTVSYYGQLFDWWSISATILGGYVTSKGEYEEVKIDNSTLLSSITLNQSFTLSEKHKLTGSLYASNTFPVTIVNTKIKNRLETEIRLRKKWNQYSFTLSAQDWFKSNKDQYYISVQELNVRDINYHDTQSVAFAISYDFGKSTVKSQRNRTVEFEEMKQRMK